MSIQDKLALYPTNVFGARKTRSKSAPRVRSRSRAVKRRPTFGQESAGTVRRKQPVGAVRRVEAPALLAELPNVEVLKNISRASRLRTSLNGVMKKINASLPSGKTIGLTTSVVLALLGIGFAVKEYYPKIFDAIIEQVQKDQNAVNNINPEVALSALKNNTKANALIQNSIDKLAQNIANLRQDEETKKAREEAAAMFANQPGVTQNIINSLHNAAGSLQMSNPSWVLIGGVVMVALLGALAALIKRNNISLSQFNIKQALASVGTLLSSFRTRLTEGDDSELVAVPAGEGEQV